MTKYIIDLPESFDPDEMKLNGFQLADRERAKRELQKTLAGEAKQELGDEIDEQLTGQRMKLNAKLTREEAIEELRKTEMLLDARARCR